MSQRIFDKARSQQGTTLAELMVVVAILGVLATVTVYLVTSVFNANIQAGQKLDQQTTIQQANSFLGKQLGASQVGDVGSTAPWEPASINRTSLAGDQFTVVAGEYCYRLMYFDSANAILVATQKANESTGRCRGGEDGIAPVAGPSQGPGGLYDSDSLLTHIDPATGTVSGELPSEAKVFSLARNVEQLPSGLEPFTFSDGGATALPVDAQANLSNTSNASFYGDAQNLQRIGSVEVSLNVTGKTDAEAIKVSNELFQQTFYIGKETSGSSGAQGASSGERLAARVATNGQLPANSRSGNVLEADGPGQLPAVDGVSLNPGDRVLVKDEANAENDGLYAVTQQGTNSLPSYPPTLYWPQMGSNLQDAATTDSPSHNGAWAAIGGSSSSCPADTISQETQSITGATGSGGIWGGQDTNWSGTDYPTYTSDSNRPYAAVHSGVLEPGETATLQVCSLPGLSSYVGSTKNGVTTSSYGSWSGSLTFAQSGDASIVEGSSSAGFDGAHSATTLSGEQYIKTTYSNLWASGGGEGTVLLAARKDTSDTSETLFSTDGLIFGSYAGLSGTITSDGEFRVDMVRNRTSDNAYASTSWSVPGPTDLNDYVGQWIGIALAINLNESRATLYLKDLSDTTNPWVNAGDNTINPSNFWSYLACASGNPCETFPGNLVFGARSNGDQPADQAFQGSISQVTTFKRDIDFTTHNLYSGGAPEIAGTPGTPWKLTRVAEFDDTSEVTPSQLFTVSEGVSAENTIWQLTTNAPIELNSTELAFARKDGVSSAAAQSLVPTGAVLPTAAATASAGYLLARGQVVSQTDYADLFAAIGTTYNIGGEASGMFRLPDLRGRVVVGADPDIGRITNYRYLGQSSGSEWHTLTVGQLPSHRHEINGSGATTTDDGNHRHYINHGIDEGHWDWQNTPTCGTVAGICSNSRWVFNGADDDGVNSEYDGEHDHGLRGNTRYTGSNNRFSVKQPYQVLNYMIKY